LTTPARKAKIIMSIKINAGREPNYYRVYNISRWLSG
jgi:hypothetical protein